ncbi:hypothetical protein, partial [Oribacterium sinus]|uniref:hypothetical protein n=1 Tax=Oribacterium sinus TaxID=237576 RepID=UPI0028EDD99C
MRRKNMLALGLSFVLGVGASSTLAYALPLEQEESHQTSASEVGNTEETASNAETVTETAVEKDTTEGSSAVEEREASDKEKEEAEEESSLSTEALGGTDRAAGETLTPLSRSRRALADPPYYASEEEEKADRKNRIISLTAEFHIADAAARDHMKVVRKKEIDVVSYAVRDINAPRHPELLSIQPDRIVEKKVGGNNWEVYTLDYFTPGVYRYKYVLEIEKGSTLFLLLGKDYGDGKAFSRTGILLKTKFIANISNESNRLQPTIALETDSAKGRKYLLEGKEFTVEAQKTIGKVYLKSSFDIHNVHVGDLMKRAILSTEKIVLTDGTEIKPDPNPIFFTNPYRSYPNNLDQWRLLLDSFKTEEGYIGDVFDIKETKAFDPGRYQISYLLQQNYQIDQYRLLMKGTDDNYGNGTEFYVNNELYITEIPAKPEADLTPRPLITSPLFDAKKVENPSKNSSGNSASSSRGNSGSSSSSGGSSSGSGSSGGSSGGGSGSFKVSSSLSGQVLGVDRSLSGGQWIQDEKGWW